MILGGCGIAVLGFVVLIIIAVFGFSYMSKDPEGVTVFVDAPLSVAMGEEFVLTVVVENQRESRAFGLTDIDLAEEYLDSFFLLGTAPEARSNSHIPIDNTRSFTFDTPIPPGETHRFSFRLRPTAVGVFRGAVDVCESSRFISTLMQTQVTEAE